eukprot:10637372-Heterocapsa_arctica.AAC.1
MKATTTNPSTALPDPYPSDSVQTASCWMAGTCQAEVPNAASVEASRCAMQGALPAMRKRLRAAA